MFPRGKLAPEVIAQSAPAIAAHGGLVRPELEAARFLIVEETDVGAAHPFSGEKLSPVLAFYRVADFAAAADLAARLLEFEGAGHSVGLHTRKPERAVELGLTLPVCRVIVNQAHCFATGGSFDNALAVLLVDGMRELGRQQHLRQPQLPAFPQHHPRRDAARPRGRPRADRRRDLRGVPAKVSCLTRTPAVATIRDAIDRHARERPDAPFVLAPEPDRVLTYRALRELAHGLAAELTARDIPPGQVVSYMLPNGISAAGVLLGAMHGGYIPSPVSLLAQDALIEHTLAHSRTRIVFAAPEFVARLEAIVARSGSRAIVRETSPDDPSIAGVPRPASAPRLQPDAPALLMYTSGTTGSAEGCAAVAREPGPRRSRGGCRARAHAGRSRAVVAAALPCQRPVHRDDLAAGLRRQRRDAAPLQRVAVVGLGRALSADVVERRADHHRVPPERRRPDPRAGRRVPEPALRALGFRAAATRAASRVRGALRHFGAGSDGAHRVRIGRVREPARSARAKARIARRAARHGSAGRRGGRHRARARARPARSSSAART